MGGNVLVKDASGQEHRADTVDFSKLKGLTRSALVKDFTEMFSAIDSLYSSEFGETLWPPGQVRALVSSGKIFTGSTEHLFDPKISDDEFVQYKPSIGDIDVTVPGDKLSNLYTLLTGLTGSRTFSDFSMQYIGKKESGTGALSDKSTQIHAIFGYKFSPDAPPVRVQIDFVASTFTRGEPSEFTRFAKSSSWSDIKTGGVKGVFHKLLLRSLSTIMSMQKDSVWLTAGSPLHPPEKVKVSKISEPIRTRSFSVDRGLRVSAEEQPITVGGKRAFKKIEPKDSKYLTDLQEIFESIFGSPPVGSEMSQFRTFYGLLELMNVHFDDSQIADVYSDFIEKLFGDGADQINAYDPEPDRVAKSSALAAFREKFSFLSRFDREIEDKMATFYDSYRTRTLESLLRSSRARYLD
jgi:hypothetical protein